MTDHEHVMKQNRQWSVEQLAWIAVALLAVTLRLGGLGVRPMEPSEATQGFAAYQFVKGIAQIAPAGTNPVLFTGNVAGFTLLGSSDAVARWLPVLAGLFLTLLPFGLRHRLGKAGALATATLLALSPMVTFYSRRLESDIFVAACALALVVGLVNYSDKHQTRALYLSAGALGLGLAAGASFYTFLVALVIFGLLVAFGIQSKEDAERPSWATWIRMAIRDTQGFSARLGAIVVSSFALAATTFVLHPTGIGQAADLLAAWAQGFFPTGGGRPDIFPMVLLLRYEPIILVMGLAGAIRALELGRKSAWIYPAIPLAIFLAFWAALATILTVLAGHGPSGNILLSLIPLALLAGQAFEGVLQKAAAYSWIERRLWRNSWMVAGGILALLVFFYLQITGYGEADPNAIATAIGIGIKFTTSYLLLAGVALLLVAGLVTAVWAWRGRESAVMGSWLALVLTLGLFGFKAFWGLNFAHASDPRELILSEATAPDVRELVDNLERLSLEKAGDIHTLPITLDGATGPVLDWYLREFRYQSTVEGLTDVPATLAAVTLAMENPPIGETFRGRGFPLRWTWKPEGMGGQDLVRWLLFTDGTLPTANQEVVLWVQDQR